MCDHLHKSPHTFSCGICPVILATFAAQMRARNNAAPVDIETALCHCSGFGWSISVNETFKHCSRLLLRFLVQRTGIFCISGRERRTGRRRRACRATGHGGSHNGNLRPHTARQKRSSGRSHSRQTHAGSKACRGRSTHKRKPPSR